MYGGLAAVEIGAASSASVAWLFLAILSELRALRLQKFDLVSEELGMQAMALVTDWRHNWTRCYWNRTSYYVVIKALQFAGPRQCQCRRVPIIGVSVGDARLSWPFRYFFAICL